MTSNLQRVGGGAILALDIPTRDVQVTDALIILDFQFSGFHDRNVNFVGNPGIVSFIL